MENLKFKTRKGVEIELDSVDMSEIHNYYEAQCTADYLRDNHHDWSEDKIQEIAYETRSQIHDLTQMDDYGFDEADAIDEAIKRYNEEHDLNKTKNKKENI